VVDLGENCSASIKNDGTLWTWGGNDAGQLGDGTVINRSSPVQIGASTDWATVGGRNRTFAAVKTDGTIWSWGRNNHGQIGDNSDIIFNRSSPVQIGALTNWSKVEAGFYNFSAVKTDGTLWSWGRNSYGQLGANDIVTRSSPIQIGALTNWANVSGGSSHIAAIKTDQTIWSWGRNNQGQIGDTTTTNRSSPVQVASSTSWSQVKCGETNTFGITSNNRLWAWGENSDGQIGNNAAGISVASPRQVGTLGGWLQVSGGNSQVVSVKKG
jgi:alpha-tubulin suppressor-like RCC1 family protein